MAESDQLLDPLHREWLLLNAVRQMVSIARRDQASYADAVSLSIELARDLLRPDSEFVDAFESDLERLFRARAEAQSNSRGEIVSPATLIDGEIQALTQELESAPADREGDLRRWLERFQHARSRIVAEKWTESQAIRLDSSTIGQGISLPISDQGRDYLEYRFHPDRLLRVRILHPDPGEWKSGVDLVYESYWDKSSRQQARVRGKAPGAATALVVRIAALQYKMWDGKKLLLSSDPRLQDQLNRAQDSFCAKGLCGRSNPNKRRYGLPHCSVFLRPTDLKQSKRGFAITRGWHLPVCEAQRELRRIPESPRIESKYVSSSSVSQSVFSELFNRSMLGSRWIPARSVEKIYKECGILAQAERVVVHAQEYGIGDTVGDLF